jgi:hypothetical protein
MLLKPILQNRFSTIIDFTKSIFKDNRFYKIDFQG